MTAEPAIPLSAAQNAVRTLFDVMKINQVIVVDDVLSTSSAISDVVAQCIACVNGGNLSALQGLSVLSQIDFEIDDQEVLTQLIRAAVQDLDVPTRQSIAIALADAKDGQPDLESESRSQLDRILSTSSVRYISLSEWNNEKTSILASPLASGTLFLFDQDMSQAEGTDVEGMRIIAGLLSEHPDLSLCCALFTHTVPPGHEYEAIDSLSKTHGIEDHKDRLVVISKGHLQTDPMAFAFRLKRVAVVPKCGQLKREVLTVVQEAIGRAQKEVEALNVYDFEQIVFQSSFLEGIWEPDTLIRLFNLFHRREARSLAMKNLNIQDAADAIRRVIDIPFKPADAPKSSSAAIRRLELFEDGDYVNSHHLPIELGDVFQLGSSRKKIYVLVGQPCDLMVRRNGKRCGCKEALLAQVSASKSDMHGMWFELPFFDSENLAANWVKFRETITVPLRVLDLTVFNDSGESKIRFDQTVPTGLASSWKQRFNVLSLELQPVYDRYEALSGGLAGSKKNEAIDCIQQAITGVNGPIKGIVDLSNNEVKFNLRRISRLKEPLASAMLRGFSAYISRDAFEHDFTSELHGSVDEMEQSQSPTSETC